MPCLPFLQVGKGEEDFGIFLLQEKPLTLYPAHLMGVSEPNKQHDGQRVYDEVETLSKGRCLVAQKSFPPGMVVLSCQSEAFVPVSSSSGASTRCWTCLQTPIGAGCLSKCKACKQVFYCSRRCQAKDWTHHHKNECPALRQWSTKPSAQHGRLPGSLVLAARVLCKALAGARSIEEANGKIVGSHFARVGDRYP